METSIDREKFLKRQFRRWAFYDFANSLLYTNIILYLPQFLTIEKGISDLSYNVILTISTILLIITAPVLGTLSDKIGKKVLFIKISSALMVIGSFLIPLVVWLNFSNYATLVALMFFFFLVSYSYQLSLVFYDAMLGEVSQKDKLTRASGFGLSAGWLGAMVGILIVYPVANGLIPGIPSGRMPAIFLSSFLFLLTGLISLKNLKDVKNLNEKKNIGFLEETKILLKNKKVLFFLIAYWIYIDAILTFEDNLTIFTERVFGIPDSTKAILAILVIVGGILGAILTGLLIKQEKAKKALFFSIVLGGISFILLGLSKTLLIFTIIIMFAAIVWGAIFALSRAVYTQITPEEHRGKCFGLYSIAARSSSIIGPLIWGLIVSVIFKEIVGYKIALIVMGVLSLIGAIPLLRLIRLDNQKL